ncbi:DEAD/DEAH box helicase [Dyella subtropica]|uniref:DEAD/DEAH box helicase n=1 Tax=Dyella subtropica TaxID=2992127 RepID=UPI00224E6ED9|nr:DEAD/DEAH box helicase family protein [Dyella subtropica]
MDVDDQFYAENATYRSWADHRLTFRLGSAANDNRGFRRPQRAAAFAILSHLDAEPATPATIIMPTGTGKTDTLIATIIAGLFRRTLIVVPSDALRTQIVGKLQDLATLRNIGAVNAQLSAPVVHVVEGVGTANAAHAIASSNVTITTAAALVQLTADELNALLAQFTHLIFDEAHHVAAQSWDRIARAFGSKPRLYFTATPFRLDEQRLGGKIIFNYPLRQAQDDGYFQKIEFHPVREYRESHADQAIASKAVDLLRADLERGLDHLLMARTSSIAKAKGLLALYQELDDNDALAPILVHSKGAGNAAKLARLTSRDSRIVVCISMLGEGFDLPELKIAAIHDHHKSPAVTLQFIGRLTRANERLGTAKFVANIANHAVEGEMRRLYEDSADWGSVIREVSEGKIGRELELQEFEARFDSDGDWANIGSLNPFPKISAMAYAIDQRTWTPDRAQLLKGRGEELKLCAVSDDKRLIVAVTSAKSPVPWASTEIISSTTWHLYMAYYSIETSTLFVSATNDDGQREKLVKLISTDAQRLDGERVFRIMDGINLLKLQNVGLTRATRDVRFTMHVGHDVNSVMDDLENGRSIKSNIFGSGHADGTTTTAGCSSKGKLWKMDSGTIDQWMRWCDLVATKLHDDTIDTAKILRNVMRAQFIQGAWPDGLFYADWPDTIGIETEGRCAITLNGQSYALTELRLATPIYEDALRLAVPLMRVREDGQEAELLRLKVRLTNDGYQVEAGRATILGGGTQSPLSEYLSRFPLRLLSVDGSFVLGNYRYYTDQSLNVRLPRERLSPWAWGDTDISKESMRARDDFKSVQGYTFLCIRDQYNVVFNDDGSGEIADLVAIREIDHQIHVDLYHCKYCNAGKAPGARVDDAYVVSGQASRSAKWLHRGPAIFQRLLERYGKSLEADFDRLLKGSPEDLEVYKSKARNLEVKLNFIIVQPAVSAAAISEEMLTVFGSSYIYLRNTANAELSVICSP